jgi:tetratricopeptide (TPR) repeat protein
MRYQLPSKTRGSTPSWIAVASSMFLLFAIACLPQASFSESEATKRLKTGDKFLAEQNYEGAVEYYTKAISLDVKFIDAYVHRGAAYRELGDLDGAINDYNRALSIKPNHDAFYNRGVVYADKGDTDKAIADYTSALGINPKSVMAYNNRGIVHASRGRYDRAIEDFSSVIALERANPFAYANRSAAYRDKGELNKAIDDLMKVAEIIPDNFHTYYNIAGIYATLVDERNACRFLKKAVEKGFRDWNYLGYDPSMKPVKESACFKEISSGRK